MDAAVCIVAQYLIPSLSSGGVVLPETAKSFYIETQEHPAVQVRPSACRAALCVHTGLPQIRMGAFRTWSRHVNVHKEGFSTVTLSNPVRAIVGMHGRLVVPHYVLFAVYPRMHRLR